MTKLLLIGLLTLSSHVIAQDCFELAGRDYKIDPDLLRAISWHESRNRLMLSALTLLRDMAPA